MRWRRWGAVPLLAVTLGAAGCGSVTGLAGWERVVGVIDIGGFPAPAPLQLPPVIRAGVAFEATVITWGSGSCTRPDGYELRVMENGWEVTPYDRERVGDVVCTDDLRSYPRTVVLRFDESGERVIRVAGRTLHPSTPTFYETRVTVVAE
jgi:hypothetical protein